MSKISKEELLSEIRDTAREAATESVQEHVKSLEEKQTNWMEDIRRESRKHDREKPKGYGIARVVRALAFAGGDRDKAARWAKQAQESTWKDELGEAVHKALAAGDLEAGGFIIPEDFSNEVIELLRNNTVVRQAGARTVPMPNGVLTMPKQTAASTSSYVGENSAISTSEPTGGQINLSAKKLAALVPVSNDLLRFSIGDQADQLVRDDLVAQVSIREDLAFIRDDGTQNTPKGMRHWAASGNVFGSNGTSSANVEADVETAINNLESNNVPFNRAVWLMAPRSKNHLLTLRDGNGNPTFPEFRATGGRTLMDRPVFVTTQIPTNLGSGSNESEIYLVDIMDALIAEAMNMQIEVSPGASFTDSGGNLVSGFEQDQTAVRAIEQHDFAMRHDESVTVINQVTWGA